MEIKVEIDKVQIINNKVVKNFHNYFLFVLNDKIEVENLVKKVDSVEVKKVDKVNCKEVWVNVLKRKKEKDVDKEIKNEIEKDVVQDEEEAKLIFYDLDTIHDIVDNFKANFYKGIVNYKKNDQHHFEVDQDIEIHKA